MKMKKIVCAMVSAALLVSMAAATAFAVESVPSKTGTDADAGKTEVSASGSVSSEGLQVEVKTTEDSSKEETQLKGEGVEKYLTAEAVDAAAKILGTEKNAVTVSEIKEIKVSGYKTGMDKITVKVPMAALPESGTTVAVIIRVKTPNGKIVNLPLAGVVVEEMLSARVSGQAAYMLKRIMQIIGFNCQVFLGSIMSDFLLLILRREQCSKILQRAKGFR